MIYSRFVGFNESLASPHIFCRMPLGHESDGAVPDATSHAPGDTPTQPQPGTTTHGQPSDSDAAVRSAPSPSEPLTPPPQPPGPVLRPSVLPGHPRHQPTRPSPLPSLRPEPRNGQAMPESVFRRKMELARISAKHRTKTKERQKKRKWNDDSLCTNDGRHMALKRDKKNGGKRSYFAKHGFPLRPPRSGWRLANTPPPETAAAPGVPALVVTNPEGRDRYPEDLTYYEDEYGPADDENHPSVDWDGDGAEDEDWEDEMDSSVGWDDEDEGDETLLTAMSDVSEEEMGRDEEVDGSEGAGEEGEDDEVVPSTEEMDDDEDPGIEDYPERAYKRRRISR